MKEDERKNENLGEKNSRVTVNNGWKEVFAYGKSRAKWTPEMLRVSFVEYLSFADGSPLPKDMKMSSKVGGRTEGSDEDTTRTVMRPYNMKSMCARLGIPNWDSFKARYCNGATEEGQEFTDLCARIENFVNGSLQEGATAGVFNAKMVMGLTDVAERVEQKVSGYAEKTDEELMSEIERMRSIAEEN